MTSQRPAVLSPRVWSYIQRHETSEDASAMHHEYTMIDDVSASHWLFATVVVDCR